MIHSSAFAVIKAGVDFPHVEFTRWLIDHPRANGQPRLSDDLPPDELGPLGPRVILPAEPQRGSSSSGLLRRR